MGRHPQGGGSREGAGASQGLPPLLKWAGGKRWLVPHLRPLFASPPPQEARGALRRGPGRGLGVDARQGPPQRHQPPPRQLLPVGAPRVGGGTPMRNDPETHYGYRERSNGPRPGGRASSKEAAELFYYLNRTGYNGLLQVQQAGSSTCPSGGTSASPTSGTSPPTWGSSGGGSSPARTSEDVPPGARGLRVRRPPYDVEFTEYAPGGFSWEDQVRPRQVARLAPRPRGGLQPGHPEGGGTLRGPRVPPEVPGGPRSISRTGDRSPALELLALKGL